MLSSCSSGDRWVRAVVEHMAEMRVAFSACNGRALHAETGVANLGDVLFCDRLPEAGPSGAGLEFCFESNSALSQQMQRYRPLS